MSDTLSEKGYFEQYRMFLREFSDGCPLQVRGSSLAAAVAEIGPSQVRPPRASERILAEILSEEIVPFLDRGEGVSPSTQLIRAAMVFRKTVDQIPHMMTAYGNALRTRIRGACRAADLVGYFDAASMRPSVYEGLLQERESKLLECLGGGAEAGEPLEGVIDRLSNLYQQSAASHFAVVVLIGPEIIMIRRVIILEDMVRSGVLKPGEIQETFRKKSWEGWGGYIPPRDLEARVKAVIDAAVP